MEKILIVDDDLDICTLLSRFLQKKGYETAYALSGQQGLKMLKADSYNLAIIDFRLPDTDGLALLQRIKATHPAVAVVIITGYSDIRTAVNSIKFGAVDYITKPLHPDELLSVIKKASVKDGGAQQKPSPVAEQAAVEPEHLYILGKNSEAQKVFSNINIVAPTALAVVIQGETGTGKEFVAREIHKRSKRANKPFVAVDCGALTETLANSEFFGHEKGAFTDAVADKDGSFKLADGGTLFLDEIENLSYDVQVKLLRALQEKKIRKVGGTRDIDTDVRVIIATNNDLRQAVKEGHFREDLYHRLNEFGIHVTPLRNRREDIPEFSRHFLKLANNEFNKNISRLDDKVTGIFNNYQWPGNLRELKNVIRRAVLLCNDGVISEDNLPEELILETQTSLYDYNYSDLKRSSMAAERQAIMDALAKTDNNKTEAARLLNIDRKTLYNKLKSHNIKYKK